MTTQHPAWPTPVICRGGAARPIAPAGGTLLAVLILLAVLPSAAAVSSAGVDAASWSTLVDALPESSASEASGAESSRGVQVAAGASLRPVSGMVRAAAPVLGVVRDSWASSMASRGLGAIPPPRV